MIPTLIEQIQAAYARDQADRREAVSSTDIPLSYDAITPRWLTNVLCKDQPGAQVESHRLDLPDSGSTNRRKIQVEYNAAGRAAGLPTALFCKATHGLANRILLGVTNGAYCEARYYNLIRPLLAIESPIGYHAAVDLHSFNSIILLGDLSQSGTEFCSHKTTMTRGRAESEMRLLATVHGRYYGRADSDAVLSTFSTWPQYFATTLGFGVREASTQGFLDGEEVIPQRLFRRAHDIWPATIASLAMQDQHPRTFAHGDVHLKNWYVAPSGEMGLSDWQCAHRGHWARDFGYAVATSLSIENRRAWDGDLLKYYLDCLEAAGGPRLPFEEAWTHYRQQLLTALTWWTVTLHPAPGLPDMQPRDTTLEFVKRLSTAMDDVDSLDSFR